MSSAAPVARLAAAVIDRAGVLGVFGLLVLLPALLAAPFGITQKVHDVHFRDRAVATTGLVVDDHDSGGRGGAVATIAIRVDGRRYQFSENVEDDDLDGHRVPVLYDPVDPTRAELADSRAGGSLVVWYLTLIFGGLAVGLVLLGLVITTVDRLWVRFRRRRFG